MLCMAVVVLLVCVRPGVRLLCAESPWDRGGRDMQGVEWLLGSLGKGGRPANFLLFIMCRGVVPPRTCANVTHATYS